MTVRITRYYTVWSEAKLVILNKRTWKQKWFKKTKCEVRIPLNWKWTCQKYKWKGSAKALMRSKPSHSLCSKILSKEYSSLFLYLLHPVSLQESDHHLDCPVQKRRMYRNFTVIFMHSFYVYMKIWVVHVDWHIWPSLATFFVIRPAFSCYSSILKKATFTSYVSRLSQVLSCFCIMKASMELVFLHKKHPILSATVLVR